MDKHGLWMVFWSLATVKQVFSQMGMYGAYNSAPQPYMTPILSGMSQNSYPSFQQLFSNNFAPGFGNGYPGTATYNNMGTPYAGFSPPSFGGNYGAPPYNEGYGVPMQNNYGAASYSGGYGAPSGNGYGMPPYHGGYSAPTYSGYSPPGYQQYVNRLTIYTSNYSSGNYGYQQPYNQYPPSYSQYQPPPQPPVYIPVSVIYHMMPPPRQPYQDEDDYEVEEPQKEVEKPRKEYTYKKRKAYRESPYESQRASTEYETPYAAPPKYREPSPDRYQWTKPYVSAPEKSYNPSYRSSYRVARLNDQQDDMQEGLDYDPSDAFLTS